MYSVRQITPLGWVVLQERLRSWDDGMYMLRYYRMNNRANTYLFFYSEVK